MNANATRWLRFILGGGINTIFSYGIYLLLHHYLMYQLAYFFSYCIGIVFSYWFNSTVVFRVSLNIKAFFAFPSVYLLQYAISAFFLGIAVNIFGLSEKFSPLIVTVVMVPITYAMTKFMLHFFAKKSQ